MKEKIKEVTKEEECEERKKGGKERKYWEKSRK